MLEHVLVVPTQILSLPAKKRYIRGEEMERILSICAKNYQFIPRPEAETDPDWRQLIPYVTIIKNDYILCLERTKAQSEARLHGKLSVGVGGHINPVDTGASLDEIILAAMSRELSEELWLEEAVAPQLQGLINDNSNPVGAVHLGLHYIAQVQTPVRVREEDKMTAIWATPPQLSRNYINLETWTQVALPFLPRREQ